MFGNITKKSTSHDFEYFSIYDSKTGQYRKPVLAINKFDLIRQIENLFKDPSQAQNEYLLNAEDFAVFKIGNFTVKTGEIEPNRPEHVVNLHEIRASIQLGSAQKPDLGIVPT